MERCILQELDYNYHLNDNLPVKECNLKQNWGFVDKKTHEWHLNDTIKLIYKNISCSYHSITKIDDFKNKISELWTLKEGTKILNDVFEVFCNSFDNKTNTTYKFDGLYIQLIEKTENLQYEPKLHDADENGCTPLNVMLISYDSVSRVSWTNRLPKTVDFLKNKMKFDILNGYNIVGDGTPAALIPIFTGQTEVELPSGLKNDPNGKYVDEIYPFIWKELHKKNYMTLYHEDWPQVGTFTYRMRGFMNKTAKYHFRNYGLRLYERFSKSNPDDLCNGDTKRHKISMNLLTDFKKMYNNKMLNLAIMHFDENSHDTNRRLNSVDDDIYTFLSDGYEQNLFENTAIFLYSDHGSRFNDKRDEKAKQRYIEERLPFFSIYFPESFKTKYPEKMKNFIKNKNLLTSPFDIYSTVRDLTCLDKPNDNVHDDRKRSISLFNKISEFRSCEDIGITEHFCSCVQSWQTQNTTNSVINDVTKFAIDSINNLTNPVRNLCAELKLKSIVSSEKLETEFKTLYKVQFITLPNKGLYEVLVNEGYRENFEFKSQKFGIKSRDDYSRIDAYGNQPRCIINSTISSSPKSDIRKFCYCFDKKIVTAKF